MLGVSVATILLALSARTALAGIIDSPADLPTNKTYDYIIVGGKSSSGDVVCSFIKPICAAGIGGSVVGARLSENPKKNVLIIEAGGKYVCIVYPP